jgi:hypothetical protein
MGKRRSYCLRLFVGKPLKSYDRFKDFVAKADDADRQADQAKKPAVQEAWRRIAANYRDLAMMEQAARRKRRKPAP